MALGEKPAEQVVIVKHSSGGCMTCLVVLLIVFIVIPIIAFTLKIAFLTALVVAALKALGIGG